MIGPMTRAAGECLNRLQIPIKTIYFTRSFHDTHLAREMHGIESLDLDTTLGVRFLVSGFLDTAPTLLNDEPRRDLCKPPCKLAFASGH